MNETLAALDHNQRIALIVLVVSFLAILIDWLITKSAYKIVILAFFVALVYLLVTVLL